MRKERSVKELIHLHSPNAEQNNNSDTATSLDNNQVESHEYSTSMLSNAHENFGNDIVQSSLSGGGSHLESVIHSSIVSDISGIGHASRDTGNGEVQQVMRAQLRGRNPEESFPDASDPRIQRIKESGGSPLPTVLREKLESEFGHNFQHVRIHNSGLDAESAQAIHAHAFTVGSHIFFNRGTYNPTSRGGMELLAHELTHVVQFDEGRIRSSSGEMEVSSPTDAVEVEAVQKGAEVARSISYSSSETLSSTNHIEGGTQVSLETAFDAGHTETATHTEESAQNETSQASDTLLRKPDGDGKKGKGGGNSEVLQIFVKEIKQGGRAKAEDMYRKAPPGERDLVEQAIRQALGDTIASEIVTENESGGGGAAVPKVDKKQPPEAPKPIEKEKNNAPSPKEGTGGGGSKSATTTPNSPKAPIEDSKNKEADLNSLSIDDLALIHQEIVEHQSWSGAQARVGQAGSVDRAAFIAEKAGEGAISGAIDGGVQGLISGGVGKLAARFIPIPGVGAIISGSMSAYGLIKDWDKTTSTIGKFGEGNSQYEVIANSIASISGVIDLVCNIMNVFAGLLGIISAVMWIVSILTVGVASPLAASLTAIASGISVVTGILDVINNLVLQPCVLLFRALHTFKSEADPRSVEAGGEGISEAASKVTGFLGGYVGGKVGEAGGNAIANGIESKRSSSSPSTDGPSSDGPTDSPDAPAQAPDAPAQAPDAPAQAPDGPTQSADGPAQAPDAPAQAPEGSSSPPEAAPAQVPDTRTPAAEIPEVDIETPRPQAADADAPTQTPDGRQRLREGMQQERAKYNADERKQGVRDYLPKKPKLPKLPEGEDRWNILGKENSNTPASGNVAKANEGVGAGAKTATAEIMKKDENPKPAALEKEASTRQVSPKYEAPPGSPEQLDALVQQIDQILATRAEASKTEQKMANEQEKHKSKKTQIDGLNKETASALSAKEAHQQAVARTQQANQAQQQRQKESQGLMDGYPERMAGVAALKGPLKIFQGFSWLGSKLPGGAGRAMARMNADANKMNEAFEQMDTQMDAQAKGQEGHKAALNEDSERLNAVSTKGQESSKNLDTAKKGAEGLSQANQGKIKESMEAKNEAQQQGAQLDQAAEAKKAEHQSLKDRLVTWARGHREARVTAQNQSKAKPEGNSKPMPAPKSNAK